MTAAARMHACCKTLHVILGSDSCEESSDIVQKRLCKKKTPQSGVFCCIKISLDLSRLAPFKVTCNSRSYAKFLTRLSSGGEFFRRSAENIPVAALHNLVRIPLFGEEQLAIHREFLFLGILRDDAVEVRCTAVALGA